MLRHLLYEAASALMTRCRQPSKLRAWGIAIARRRGAKRARVAVARKLAVIMHRMWVSGSVFETGVEKPKLAAAWPAPTSAPLCTTATWTTGPASPTRPL